MKKLAGTEVDIVRMEERIERLERIIQSMSNHLLPIVVERQKEKDEQEKDVRGMLYG